jgi:cell division protein FtsW
MTATTTPGTAPAGAVGAPVGPARRPARRLQTRRRSATARVEAAKAARLGAPPPAAFYVLAGVISVLTMLGLVMVLSASSVSLLHQGRSPWAYFDKQVVWAVLGTISMVTTMRVPYERWRKWVLPILVGAFGLMLAPFVPGLGVSVNGAHAWVQVGPIGFQPSEFLKFAVLLYCADLLTKRERYMHRVKSTLWPCLVVVGISGMLCLAQGDLGSAIVLGAIVLAVAFIGGTPLVPFAGTSAALGIVSLGFVMSTKYRRDRWLAFLHPKAHCDHLAYQLCQGMVGLADGGLSGVGIGASRQKWNYLPLAHSDFIFAIIGEELGLLGVLGVLGAYVLLAYFGTQVALGARDRFGMLLAGGVTAWITVQALINVGGVTGLMPLTGLTLPFVSFGGSSLLATMTAAGLLLNVARSSR